MNVVSVNLLETHTNVLNIPETVAVSFFSTSMRFFFAFYPDIVET